MRLVNCQYNKPNRIAIKAMVSTSNEIILNEIRISVGKTKAIGILVAKNNDAINFFSSGVLFGLQMINSKTRFHSRRVLTVRQSILINLSTQRALTNGRQQKKHTHTKTVAALNISFHSHFLYIGEFECVEYTRYE